MTPRRAAIASGAVHYYSRPCKYGHDSARYTKTGHCVTCAAAISSSKEKKAYDADRVIRLKDKLSEQAKSRYLQQRGERIKSSKAWAAANPERRRAIASSYKSRRRSQEAVGITGAELLAWKRAQKLICFWCDSPCESSHEVDHFTPLSRGGQHVTGNLVIACRPCNARKSNKMPEVFLGEVLSGKIAHIQAP